MVLARGWKQRATRLLYSPSPQCGGEESGKKKAKELMGWDEGSLTEQQMKKTVTAITLARRKCKTKQ